MKRHFESNSSKWHRKTSRKSQSVFRRIHSYGRLEIGPLNSRISEFRKRWTTTSIEVRTSNFFVRKTYGIVGQECIHWSALARSQERDFAKPTGNVKWQEILLEACNTSLALMFFPATTRNEQRVYDEAPVCGNFAKGLLNKRNLITLM
jgi:hypothetical protein